MIKLMRKGFCAMLGLIILTGLSSPPVHGADTYEFKYTPSVIGQLAVPIGARIQFQTPPLKKNEKLSYTAGNGEILHTFVSGKPIENADGTIRYQLGYECCKEGETGIYINWNGKTQMLFSIWVVNDKSKAGFPLSTSFGKIFENQTVEKIAVEVGESIESKRVTNDSAKISRFMASLTPERLYRDCNPKQRVGCLFSVDFYLKEQNGYYRYILGYGFYKVDGFSVSLPTGNCVEGNEEEIYKLIGNFYTNLS